MRRDLRGARILIAGASNDVGRRLVERAAGAGARLAVVARSTEPLFELAGKVIAAGGEVLALPADVTSERDRQQILSAIEERFGGIDVLINNASASSWGRFSESSEESLRQILEVDFFAPAELIRSAIPMLQKGRQPAIVNVASMCGRRGIPGGTESSASKFALCGLTEALRGELVRFAIDILLVLPGSTGNDRGEDSSRTIGRRPLDFDAGLSAERIADGILRALKKNRTETIIGRDARWLLGVNRLLPRVVDALMARTFRRQIAS